MKMLLELEVEDRPLPPEQIACNELMVLIHDRFSVYPVQSVKAYEDFSFVDGEQGRIVHHVFSVGTNGSLKNNVEKLKDTLWRELKKAYPPGTFMVWRRYPKMSEEKTEGIDNYVSVVSVRVGTFIEPIRCQAWSPAGEPKFIE